MPRGRVGLFDAERVNIANFLQTRNLKRAAGNGRPSQQTVEKTPNPDFSGVHFPTTQHDAEPKLMETRMFANLP
jgi:hypothetical protein